MTKQGEESAPRSGVRGEGPRSFRKRPVVIEAMRWAGSAEAARPVINWVLTGGRSARWHDPVGELPDLIAIDTLEGTMNAAPGDWIIKGVQGEFYPCKPDIFAVTYEPAPTTPTGGAGPIPPSPVPDPVGVRGEDTVTGADAIMRAALWRIFRESAEDSSAEGARHEAYMAYKISRNALKAVEVLEVTLGPRDSDGLTDEMHALYRDEYRRCLSAGGDAEDDYNAGRAAMELVVVAMMQARNSLTTPDGGCRLSPDHPCGDSVTLPEEGEYANVHYECENCGSEVPAAEVADEIGAAWPPVLEAASRTTLPEHPPRGAFDAAQHAMFGGGGEPGRYADAAVRATWAVAREYHAPSVPEAPSPEGPELVARVVAALYERAEEYGKRDRLPEYRAAKAQASYIELAFSDPGSSCVEESPSGFSPSVSSGEGTEAHAEHAWIEMPENPEGHRGGFKCLRCDNEAGVEGPGPCPTPLPPHMVPVGVSGPSGDTGGGDDVNERGYVGPGIPVPDRGQRVMSDGMRDDVREKGDSVAGVRDEMHARILRLGEHIEAWKRNYNGMVAERDAVYTERNRVVLAFAALVSQQGWPVGTAVDPGQPDWPVLLVDTDAGQVSWHLKPEEMPAGVPVFPTHYDGHTTDEKYARLAEIVAAVFPEPAEEATPNA